MIPQPSRLPQDARQLGHWLGELLYQQDPGLFDRVEQIRQLGQAVLHRAQDRAPLDHLLASLPDAALLPVARAFAFFLNLANTAEQVQDIREDQSAAQLVALLQGFLQKGLSATAILEAVAGLDIGLVLTAHPTEVSRRTLIQKYDQIAHLLLRANDPSIDRTLWQQRLQQVMLAAWHTREIRSTQPTVVDEARWGFAVVEHSLWQALPRFLRRLDLAMQQVLGQPLPFEATPVRFASWIGGDRDGNPNVTHRQTREILWLAHWQACSLYLRDVEQLRQELSMAECSADFLHGLGHGSEEPYREALRALRDRLRHQLQQIEQALTEPARGLVFLSRADLWVPLMAIRQSLLDTGLETLAGGTLRDVLWRLQHFGLHLLPLDIRQSADRHAGAVAALVHHAGLGDYLDWDEPQRLAFLQAQLSQQRPLLPHRQLTSGFVDFEPEVREVLQTVALLADQPAEALGAYVISMARQASDVLAVALLQQEMGVSPALPVVPLFETLDDLQRAPQVMAQLFALPLYRQLSAGRQQVMIGYSDSAKDAGFLAASWAQYQAQEQLTAVARQAGYQLTLFHGRGGSTSRGGAPVRAALMAQPPGTVGGRVRVTEQGEMIRFKFGLEGNALTHLHHYLAATLEASLTPPPEPDPAWHTQMDQLAAVALQHYRHTVYQRPELGAYLRTVTPEQELQLLPLGSRPARRQTQAGLTALRAIPWVFAWTQIRLMLPAWLGTGVALQTALNDGQQPRLMQMREQWPYFRTLLAMLSMVLDKADASIAAHYETTLTTDPALQQFGQHLRDELQATRLLAAQLAPSDWRGPDNPNSRPIQARMPYLLPLHLLQAELMRRRRLRPDPAHEAALMVTIAGIAAGLRNTG